MASSLIVGTSSIVHEKTHQPLLSTLASVVETVIHLREQGHKVVLVSSGAIGVGLKRMNVANKPKSLSGKQVSLPTSGYMRCFGCCAASYCLFRGCTFVAAIPKFPCLPLQPGNRTQMATDPPLPR